VVDDLLDRVDTVLVVQKKVERFISITLVESYSIPDRRASSWPSAARVHSGLNFGGFVQINVM
jgi:hypothetical protein